MRKYAPAIVFILCAALLFAGCGIKPETAAPGENGGRLAVYASFYPVYDFALKIGGDRAQVFQLVPPGSEPHSWEPSAADIVRLASADVLVCNGAGMEHWLDTVLASLENEKLTVVNTSQNLTLLAATAHSHDEDGEAGHGREAEGEGRGHEGDADDPHTWLNPMNAKIQMAAIRDAFGAADPDNSAYYAERYEIYAAELDKLDREYRETLAPLPRRDIVVSHTAFGYLCAAYGLHQIGIEGLTPDSEPDPARMAEIIDLTKERGITTVFAEELVSPAVAEAVAAATGAKVAVLNPIGGLSAEQQQNGDDYFSVMRRNLAALQKALS